MLKKRKKPGWGLVIFGLVISGIIFLIMILRVLIGKTLALITLQVSRRRSK